MLRGPGQYKDMLRVIGRLLDEREVLLRAETTGSADPSPAAEGQLAFGCYEDVEIVEHEAFVRVSWRTRAGSAARQAYTDLNLAKLRARSRQLRGGTTADPAGEREELLRTLGQELDAEDLHVSGILEKDEAYFVSGSADGCYFHRSYPKDELLSLSRHRRSLRATADRDEPVPVAAPAGSQRSQWLLWGAGPGR